MTTLAPLYQLPRIGDSLTATKTHLSRSKTVLTAGETTAADGLAITPSVGNHRWLGGWSVTHQQSGLHLVLPNLLLAYAREIAAALAATEVDWTQPVHVLGRAAAAKDANTNVLGRYLDCREDGLPMWWARGSLVQCAPQWHVDNGDEQWQGTWSQLVRILDTTPDDFGAPTVTYDARPTWVLQCAAPLCGLTETQLGEPSPACLLFDDGYLLRSIDRNALRAEAPNQGWRQHGRYWMCPECRHEHHPVQE